MSHWPFIAAAYGFTFLATLGLLWHSLAAMRRAEGEAQALKDRS